ncbi:LysR family substrate-binding domain-containing protein [Nocardiopsis tropica]|uniref:LysR family substrate-binding domain-containing protein n=1 Tax=Tsukamurella strandjordii TaxID=147577 RepID=UPI0031DDBB29
MTSPSLRVGYVPGATPAKWVRIWGERHPDAPLELVAVDAADAAEAVRSGTVDLALLRLPTDVAGLAVIPLYEEATVAVVPKDHVITAVDEIALQDLHGEPVLLPHDDTLAWPDAPGAPVEHRPATTAEAIELVAAGLGALVVPQSLARLHHRKDLTYRPITDAPPAPVALAVAEGEQPEPVADFIGIVRGRRASSSRGRDEPAPKRTAREKTLAKQAARAAAGKKANPGKSGGKGGVSRERRSTRRR